MLVAVSPTRLVMVFMPAGQSLPRGSAGQATQSLTLSIGVPPIGRSRTINHPRGHASLTFDRLAGLASEC